MCTAITFNTEKEGYFGRTLDLDYSNEEKITIMPRKYPLRMRIGNTIKSHYAVIGMARIENSYPLFYDGMNEKGVFAAALAFPESCKYHAVLPEKNNIASFEIIPYLLGSCDSLAQIRYALENINVTDTSFSDNIKESPLHWIIGDRHGAITLESRENGIDVLENRIGVLTNEPPFEYHLMNLKNYMNITSCEPMDRLSGKGIFHANSKGMGAIGLPGDSSSQSRFVKAVFEKLNCQREGTEMGRINQMFHVLSSVSTVKGTVKSSANEKSSWFTRYTSAISLTSGLYYYRTYENSSIVGVNMFNENLDDSSLISYSPLTIEKFAVQNSAH